MQDGSLMLIEVGLRCGGYPDRVFFYQNVICRGTDLGVEINKTRWPVAGANCNRGRHRI